MATSYKVLAQSSPSATTNTDIYTCPTSTSTIISSISVCNRSEFSQTYRIAIRPSGESIANKHYIVYNATLNSEDSVFLTVGATVSASDVVTVYCSSADLSFNIFGSEIT